MENLKTEIIFSPNSYQNIGVDQLVIFCVKRILDNFEECTFERLVFECFTLFPSKFGFLRYPIWPDSARINKAWLRCRTDKGWLAGTVKEGFRLTPDGEEVAIKTEKELNYISSNRNARTPSQSRERHETIINRIKTSQEYQNFCNNINYDISVPDLKYFLGGTLETPKRILRHNLNNYFNAATIYNEKSIIPFLKLCKLKLEKLME